MCERIVRLSAAVFCLLLAGTLRLNAQAAAEYGMATANAAGAATGGRALIPFPNINIPQPGGANAPGGAPGQAAGGARVTAGTAESAAKTNLEFFQSHAGADAGHVIARAVPEHAMAWIDGRFVGPAPIDLKLPPGHHQLLLRSPSMQQTIKEFDVTAKQNQTIDLTMKSAYQSQVTVHWPSAQAQPQK